MSWFFTSSITSLPIIIQTKEKAIRERKTLFVLRITLVETNSFRLMMVVQAFPFIPTCDDPFENFVASGKIILVRDTFHSFSLMMASSLQVVWSIIYVLFSLYWELSPTRCLNRKVLVCRMLLHPLS